MKSPNIDPRLQQRLEEAELRLPEVDSQLASPEVLSSPKRLKDLGRERARLDEIVTASRELRSAIEGHSEAVELLQETDDPEMKGLAEEEISVLGKRIEQLALQVRELLIPPDPLLTKNSGLRPGINLRRIVTVQSQSQSYDTTQP